MSQLVTVFNITYIFSIDITEYLTVSASLNKYIVASGFVTVQGRITVLLSIVRTSMISPAKVKSVFPIDIYFSCIESG